MTHFMDVQIKFMGHPLITSTRRGSGSGGRLRTGGGRSAPSGRSHRKYFN